MKCIYCGKEIANGNMCEECSNKRNSLGYTTISSASENIQNISTTQKLYCKNCGKEIVNGSICEECSSKRNNLGYTTISSASENILDNSSTQRLYCKYCGSPLNDDGSCTSFTCQKQREKEADKNTHFFLSLILAIFSSLGNGWLILAVILTIISAIISGNYTNITNGFFLTILINFFLFIPKIILYSLTKGVIATYRKYKDSPISKTRKILNYINVVNFYVYSIEFILLFVSIIIIIYVNVVIGAVS